jgi:tetratricopeptide (TPR) repeat protein
MAKNRSLQPRTQVKVQAPTQSRVDLAIVCGLAALIFLVYWQVRNFDFTTYDDDLYVMGPAQAGITLDSLKWAFTAVVSNNWIPVTLLSHILDVQLFGMQSGMHHLMNVVWHVLATLLLFSALRRATGAVWRSAFVAFIFGLHPLHVGSVAWIAERKDVLSAFFWFLALYAYVRYAEQPGLRRYLLMAAAFTLGLLAKPMVVTFPFVLLLLDVWPLRRFAWPKVVLEKLPLMLLSAVASVITYLTQSSTGAVVAMPLAVRVENALVSYAIYIKQMFWPAGLAVIYPYSQSIPIWQALVALALLIAVTLFAVRVWRTHPYVATGWFWYLGTLVPVIGLIQVGEQAHADRYTYIPLVGLAMILAWGAAEILNERTIYWAAGLSAVACIAMSWIELPYWQNSETLFQRAVDVTGNNWIAEYNLGHCLMTLPGRIPDAISHFRAALRIKPDYVEARNNLGACLQDSGHAADAVQEFQTVVRLKPGFADAHFNLGLALSKLPDRSADAITEFESALYLNPRLESAHVNLAALLVKLGRPADAIPHFEAAVRLNADYRNERNLGAVLATLPGRKGEAIVHLEAAQRLHPDPETANFINSLRLSGK